MSGIDFRDLPPEDGAIAEVYIWIGIHADDVACGERPGSDMAKVEEAFALADAGEEWRLRNLGAWRVAKEGA